MPVLIISASNLDGLVRADILMQKVAPYFPLVFSSNERVTSGGVYITARDEDDQETARSDILSKLQSCPLLLRDGTIARQAILS